MYGKGTFIICFMLAILVLPSRGLTEEQKEEQKKVWATIGSEVIDEAYVESAIKTLPHSVQTRSGVETLRSYVIENIVDVKLLTYGARQAHLEERPEIKFQINDSTEKLLAKAYVEFLENGVTVSAGEIKDYYDKHRDQYHLPEQMKLRHIAVKTQQEATEILSELKKGVDFGKIAGEKSIYKTNDGDLGWVQRGRLNPKLEEKVFKLKKGDLSKINIDDEYHIVRVEDYKGPGERPLKELQDQIGSQLREEKKKKVVEEAREALRAKLAVQFFNPNPPVPSLPASEKKPGSEAPQQ